MQDLQGFLDGHTPLGDGTVGRPEGRPLGLLRRREAIGSSMRYAHRQQVQPEAFELENALGRTQELDLQTEGRTVLLVELNEALSPMQSDVVATMPPERGIGAAVETVMHRQEVADLIP